MDICIRSCLTSGLVVVGVSALIVAPVASPRPTAPSAPPPLALAAQVQPLRQLSAQALPTRPTTSAAIQPLNLLTQQVSFHIAFVADFLSTGAVLFGREFAIPGALLQAVQHGTPVPVAVSRALQAFAQVEIEAGRDLVGFAAQYVSFQLNFVANLMAMPFAAIGQFAAAQTTPHAAMTAVTAANITTAGPSGGGTLQRVDDSQATSSTHTVTLQLKRSRSVAPESESDTKTTPKTPGAATTSPGRSSVTDKPATGASETMSSTAGQADAGSRHQPHHEHDGHPKGVRNEGD
jgi:hypothetical protein